MATHTDGGPAFPGAFNRAEDKGMSLRDWFAGQALPQVIAHAMTVRATMIQPGDFNFSEIARTSYMVADAMLAAREK